MVDTDDTRRTTDDGQRTTPGVWHKLPTSELQNLPTCALVGPPTTDQGLPQTGLRWPGEHN